MGSWPCSLLASHAARSGIPSSGGRMTGERLLEPTLHLPEVRPPPGSVSSERTDDADDPAPMVGVSGVRPIWCFDASVCASAPGIFRGVSAMSGDVLGLSRKRCHGIYEIISN